jgi:hypothetical protein
MLLRGTTELVYVNAPHSLDSELPEDDSSSSSSGSSSSRSPVRRRSLTAAAASSGPDLQVVYGEASGNSVNSTTAADAQQYEAWPADKEKVAVNAATAAAGATAGTAAGTTAGATAGASSATDDQRCWW